MHNVTTQIDSRRGNEWNAYMHAYLRNANQKSFDCGQTHLMKMRYLFSPFVRSQPYTTTLLKKIEHLLTYLHAADVHLAHQLVVELLLVNSRIWYGN